MARRGSAMHTIRYNPNRAFGVGKQVAEGERLEADGFPAYSSVWGDKDNYGNRGERYLAGVAYLDGAAHRPSAVMCRGYYTRSYLRAVDFDGKQLTTKWLHASLTPHDWVVMDGEAQGNQGGAWSLCDGFCSGRPQLGSRRCGW